jgi:hypothetical protein
MSLRSDKKLTAIMQIAIHIYSDLSGEGER